MNNHKDTADDLAQGLGELSRLYGDAASLIEPPEPTLLLDETILAAARGAVGSAVATLPQRTYRTSRWGVPLALAATVVMTVSVTMMVHLEQQPKVALLPAPSVEPAMPAAELAKSAESETLVAGALRQRKRAEPTASPMAKPAFQPEQDEHRQVVDNATAVTALAPVAPATFAEPSALSQRERADTASSVGSVMEGKIAPAPASESAPSREGGMLQKRAQSFSIQVSPLREKIESGALAGDQKSPERWIEDIRELKRTGRMTESADRLVEFKKRFPDYKLPNDLR